MHDCPGCQVPLHGHEAYCPVCGQKQSIRLDFQLPTMGIQERSSNPIGLILVLVVVIGVIVYAVQSSWIGQIIRRGPVTFTEDTPATQLAAREKLENTLNTNLAGQSTSIKFVYMADGKTVDRNYPQKVELTIDVKLKDPSKRRSIIEPVKNLLEPAHINTLTLTEENSHATLTYTVSGAGDNDTDASNSNTANSDNTGD